MNNWPLRTVSNRH